ncbi:radical SAM protein [Patescibacteria group bacterium]|nr:radical SAM protein [Patescibacteria group bacterium]
MQIVPRLLLINPAFARKINGQTPLNLAYLASAVEKEANTKIIDLNVEPQNNLYKLLTNFKPTHVGITRYTPNNIDSLKILKEIKEKYPNIITITGGPHEIFRGDITKMLNPWIDYVVRDRNGEESLLKIVAGNEKMKLDWKKLFPAYHLLNMKEKSYRFHSEIFPGKKMLQYMSARGCPLNCNFCPSGNYEPKDIEVVIEHLKKIINMGYGAVFFNDVNFAAITERTKKLMKNIIKEGLPEKLEWGCQTTANDFLEDTLIELMAQAGCNYITYSLENVSKKGLKIINKKINPKTVTHKCKIAKEVGMKIGLYVMFGIHNDEKEDFYWVKKTLDKIAKIKPNYVSYSILADYPNSNPALPYETKKFGTENIWKFFDEGCAYHPHCSVEYAEEIKKEILKRHNSDLKIIKIF